MSGKESTVAGEARAQAEGAARFGAVISIAFIVAGTLIGMLVQLSPFEPLLEVDDPQAHCHRGRWDQRLFESRYWHHTTSLPLGTPYRVAQLFTRFDVPAAAGIAAATGLALADADTIVADAMGRSEANHSFLVLLKSELLVSSLDNYDLTQSSSLANCTTPVAGAPLAVCDERIFHKLGDPNESPAGGTWKGRAGVVLVPAAALSDAALLAGADGELFVDAGDSEGRVLVGATTVCHTRTSNGVRLAKPQHAYAATRDATTGFHVNGSDLVASAETTCEAPNLMYDLLPTRSAHPRAFLGVEGLGVADADVFASAACGTIDGTRAGSVVGCAATADASVPSCAHDAAVPFYDLKRRAFELAWSGESATLRVGETTRVYSQQSELFEALWRFGTIALVSLVADLLSRCGASAGEVLSETLRWASEPDADGPPPCALDISVSVTMLALRIAQLILVSDVLLANRALSILLIEVVSIAASALILALRVSVRSDGRQRIVLGGSTWLLEASLALLSIATHWPLAEDRATHGFSYLARVAVGSLVTVQVLPRVSVAGTATFCCVRSKRMSEGFRALCLGITGVHLLQGAAVAALVFNTLFRALIVLAATSYSATMLSILFPVAFAFVLVVIGLVAQVHARVALAAGESLRRAVGA